MIENNIKSKSKPFIIFVFSLISIVLCIISTSISPFIFKDYCGLLLGILLMIISIPLHIFGKKCKCLYIISFILNSLGNGFAISAYYIETKIPVDFSQMLLAVTLPIVLLLIVCLILHKFSNARKAAMITFTIINIILLILLLYMWISTKDFIYSFCFFTMIINIFMAIILNVLLKHDNYCMLRYISFAGFSAFIVIAYIVLVILSEGDALDIGDLSSSNDSQVTKKKKVK